MPIFNYSFNKILKSSSSYILLIISTVVLTGILTVAAFLTSSKLPSNFTVQDFLDQSYSTWILISFAVFIDIILFIFIAIKTTQVFRDEIEDGTLLILVSKPVNRTKIFFEKFLAFELVVGLFIVISNIVASLSLFIFGTNAYKALAPKILILIAFMLFLQIIFFVLTLLISLFTTSKTLVAITIVIGVVASILTFLIQQLIVWLVVTMIVMILLIVMFPTVRKWMIIFYIIYQKLILIKFKN
ncbi:ABC transporter permease [Spiroplasma endosymbiont of Virgichneumon dumeticola]|uniref:ABC transporter permease n=1 Tax=Spiroplasma endosymbiont of Virgichneumon dumeticola TaxID=3139323 RepID=UPI0035C8C67D